MNSNILFEFLDITDENEYTKCDMYMFRMIQQLFRHKYSAYNYVFQKKKNVENDKNITLVVLFEYKALVELLNAYDACQHEPENYEYCRESVVKYLNVVKERLAYLHSNDFEIHIRTTLNNDKIIDKKRKLSIRMEEKQINKWVTLLADKKNKNTIAKSIPFIRVAVELYEKYFINNPSNQEEPPNRKRRIEEIEAHDRENRDMHDSNVFRSIEFDFDSDEDEDFEFKTSDDELDNLQLNSRLTHVTI